MQTAERLYTSGAGLLPAAPFQQQNLRFCPACFAEALKPSSALGAKNHQPQVQLSLQLWARCTLSAATLRTAAERRALAPVATFLLPRCIAPSACAGMISYPRTESTAFAPGFDLAAAVREQRSHPIWGDYAASMLAAGVSHPKACVAACRK